MTTHPCFFFFFGVVDVVIFSNFMYGSYHFLTNPKMYFLNKFSHLLHIHNISK